MGIVSNVLSVLSTVEWAWLIAFSVALAALGAALYRRRPPELVARTEAEASARRAES